MPARLRLRASYQHDAAFMLKLADAIERDDEIPADMRNEAIRKLNDLSGFLLRLKGPLSDRAAASNKAAARR